MEIVALLNDKLLSMWLELVKTLPQLALAFLVILLSWASAKFINNLLGRLLRRTKIRASLRELLKTLAHLMVWLTGVLIAVTIVFPSVTPGKLLAALGLGSVAIGFAFKDIFENFIAGALIMLREPMRLGDFIECEGVEGKIERIAIRDTYIRQPDDQLVILPNAMLYKNPVYIRTDRELRRFSIVCGVAYGEDVDKAATVIKEALEKAGEVEQSKGVHVFAREFNSSSVDYTVMWWAHSTPIDMHKSRDKVVRTIKRALDDAGIEIPFPYRTLTFKGPVPIEMKTAGPELEKKEGHTDHDG
ncbi:hypothetical protein GCM10007972_04320 [Iodidimonas muriae]|uniref:Small-conductance mechanosensitive channel n=1 Tax=Iodidimonas muriae TaxID=261467 RepID=A0ABQ2L7S6_9PROT|nr:mechanosensitive ion channel family protein [Iodidimonas muriae]GER08139.1 hypothetical protein JCM17843_24490 [Kordiimonadales bacterium JCM 17843]GGO06216.1 hypothetical protein GCM10007972_04320 [Iodidimonas muriae]